MNLRFNAANSVAFAFIAVLSAGCQTPSAVYELSEKTASSAAIFQSHLADVAAQSKSLAQARADHVVAMDAFNARLDAVLKRELFMRQRSNPPADWAEMKARIDELTALRDDLIAIEQGAKLDEDDRRKEILAQQTALSTFKTSLQEAANALTALAQRESKAERAKFIGRYLGEVRKDLDDSMKGSDQTSQAAKALVDALKAKIKDTEPADAGASDQ